MTTLTTASERRTAIAVLVTCFLLNLLGRGSGDTYAVFLVPLERKFGWARSQLTSVYSAYLLVGAFVAPMARTLFDRFGPRATYTVGLLVLGSAFYLAWSLGNLWEFYKRIICQEMGWSSFNNWTNPGNGIWDPANTDYDANTPFNAAQKCSSTWTNGLGVVENPTGIQLDAGSRYYLEFVLHNGTGGDNGSVTAQLFDDPAPTNGQPTTLRGNLIQGVTWQPTTFTWAQQPLNATVPEGQTATFRARATSDGEFAPHYQWFRGGVPVAGATRTEFALANLLMTDNNAQLSVVATIPLMQPITSSVAVLTVQQAVF